MRAAPLLLGALALAACDARPRAATDPNAGRPHSGPAIAVLDLRRGVPEQAPSSLWAQVTHPGTFDDLVSALDKIREDKDVKGAFVRFGSVNFGLARATELGAALEALRRAQKPVTCHGDSFSNTTFYAAARGCSKILLSPSGEIETVGIAAQVLYGHKLLSDELHLSVDILQVGKFKGAEEPLTRDGPSDEARASLENVLVDLRASWLDGMAGGARKPGVAAAVEDGPYAAKRALQAGLVDGLAYADDARDQARSESTAVRDELRFGVGADADHPDDLGDLVRALSGEEGTAAPIALVRATGSIAMSRGGGILGGASGITEHDMDRLLARLERNDDVRAVVLRIDSPGGSALASDLIWHRLMKLRDKKPLVVSVGDMAASGGYYLASTATVIFAEPASIVGSIGVVGGKIAIGSALERIGVHTETFAANKDNPGAAARAAAESALTPWDDATRQRMLEAMTGVYELFLSRVAEGRRTTVDKIAPSAEGRIWSGRQGKERGLVDELGGLEDAIARARSLAKLPADAGVEAVEPSRSLLEAFGGGGDEEGGGEGRVEAAAVGFDPLRALGHVVPDLVPFLAGFAPLLDGERWLASLPYALIVR